MTINEITAIASVTATIMVLMIRLVVMQTKIKQTLFPNGGSSLMDKMNDSFYYTPEVLHELLRDVWTHEGWTDTPDMSSEYISRSAKPSEGGNRMALLSFRIQDQ